MDRRRYLVLASLGVAGLAGCTGDEDPELVTETESEERTDTEGDSTDDTATTEDGTATDGETESAPDAVDAVVGDLVEGDQMSLVVESFERGADLGEFAEPDSGNEFVQVEMALKNTSSEYVSVSNLLQTRLRDDEDYQYDQTVGGSETRVFNGGQFAPGEVERGAIPFELPTDAAGLRLVFDFTVSVFGGVDRATIDLTSEADQIHRLEQELQVDVYSPGETVADGDVETTLEEFRTESSLGEFAQPDDGNEYGIVDISIRNDTGEEKQFSTLLQMMLKDGEGYTYQEDLTATSQLDRAFDEGTPLSDGETRRGELVYEIESGLSPLYWAFEFAVFATGNKTFWELQ
ncbi:MAG: DUF4352 domain-containing protein [Halolamina sp.]